MSTLLQVLYPQLELYHLASDPGERVNVANALPERANQLAAQLAAWRQSVGAQMPVPNPAHGPAPRVARLRRQTAPLPRPHLHP